MNNKFIMNDGKQFNIEYCYKSVIEAFKVFARLGISFNLKQIKKIKKLCYYNKTKKHKNLLKRNNNV